MCLWADLKCSTCSSILGTFLEPILEVISEHWRGSDLHLVCLEELLALNLGLTVIRNPSSNLWYFELVIRSTLGQTLWRHNIGELKRTIFCGCKFWITVTCCYLWASWSKLVWHFEGTLQGLNALETIVWNWFKDTLDKFSLELGLGGEVLRSKFGSSPLISLKQITGIVWNKCWTVKKFKLGAGYWSYLEEVLEHLIEDLEATLNKAWKSIWNDWSLVKKYLVRQALWRLPWEVLE